ncbi:MAG: phage tail tip lysozyme, partial [Pseudomonadota bacterium]
ADAAAAARLVAGALRRAAGRAARPTRLEDWIETVAPAMPMDATDWALVGRVLETEVTRNREGRQPMRLGTDSVAARTFLMDRVVRRRLGAAPAGGVPPRARRMLAQSIGRAGHLIDWVQTDLDYRRRYIMRRLVERYGLPVNGAAGIVGNLQSESGLLPQRVEGSRSADPRRTRGTAGPTRRWTAAQIQGRRRGRSGPRLPGVGLAQWTSANRRSGLFDFEWRDIPAGADILYHMDRQIAYLVDELRGYRRVWRVVTDPRSTVRQAAAQVLMDFETPGAVLQQVPRPGGGTRTVRRPMTDPQVVRIVDTRTRNANAALRAHRAGQQPAEVYA